MDIQSNLHSRWLKILFKTKNIKNCKPYKNKFLATNTDLTIMTIGLGLAGTINDFWIFSNINLYIYYI